jgi:hypothetical protein
LAKAILSCTFSETSKSVIKMSHFFNNRNSAHASSYWVTIKLEIASSSTVSYTKTGDSKLLHCFIHQKRQYVPWIYLKQREYILCSRDSTVRAVTRLRPGRFGFRISAGTRRPCAPHNVRTAIGPTHPTVMSLLVFFTGVQ